ncbi:spore coat-associated protein S [Paenibacillaceae bacterium GAS479]|nr:spore coat-associated protein S [Paenibacillaceae bacterium GAS479]
MENESNVKAILSKYPLSVKDIQVINDKGKKAAWSIETSSGTKILKKSPADKDRLLFLLQAIKHLQKNGARIPKIVATRSGADFADDASGSSYVLSDAVSGTSPKSYTRREMNLIMREMGRFHKASQGFQSKSDTRERSHLGRWESSYQSHLDNLELYKAVAKLNDNDFSKLYLKHVDRFIAQGKEALGIIQGKAYLNWVNKVSINRNLCHQDFAAGNLIKARRGYHVIDLDSLTIDLPARDIRKIFNKIMKKKGWSILKATSMLRAYHGTHPLKLEECRVIYADLLYPHLFYGMASKYFNNRLEWDLSKSYEKFEALIQNDQSRMRMLRSWNRIIRNAIK